MHFFKLNVTCWLLVCSVLFWIFLPLKPLVLNANDIDCQERIYPQACRFHCSLPSPEQRCWLKLVPVSIPFWNVGIIKACHGFLFFKKLSSNPMAAQFCNEPLVWNLIKDIFKNNVCYVNLIAFILIITENIPEIQKPCNFF